MNKLSKDTNKFEKYLIIDGFYHGMVEAQSENFKSYFAKRNYQQKYLSIINIINYRRIHYQQIFTFITIIILIYWWIHY